MGYRVVLLLLLVSALASAAAVGQRSARPAGLGQGPAASLKDLSGPQFDKQYVRSMYQQFSDISVLASRAIRRLTDKDLRSLSTKIRDSQTDEMSRLEAWAVQMDMGTLHASGARVSRLQKSLSRQAGASYEAAYANILIALLQQSRRAATLATSRSTISELRDQATITASSANSEISTLRSWLARRGHPVSSRYS